MDKVIYYVERSNQRGGRMLSVIDLIDMETISHDMCAWMLMRIINGKSWMVGAVPGGAGKTTIMSAFLCMLPPNENIFLTTFHPEEWEGAEIGSCILSYEISRGHYDGYIWGERVKKFTELGKKGCRLVTNLHADTLEQAKKQIVDECDADSEGFNSIDTFIPISLSGKGIFKITRKIENIWYYEDNRWQLMNDTFLTKTNLKKKPFSDITKFLHYCINKNIRFCSDVRREWLKRLYPNEGLSRQYTDIPRLSIG